MDSHISTISSGCCRMVSGRLRKKYGIEGEAREELYSCADAWLAALDGRQFLGGAHTRYVHLVQPCCNRCMHRLLTSMISHDVSNMSNHHGGCECL